MSAGHVLRVPRALLSGGFQVLLADAVPEDFRIAIEFDSENHSVLICDYTGKEVVGCKVQMHIVVPDQVRWLRLRAVALILWGVSVDPLVGESRDLSRKQSVSMG
jgi:hypothetical protein